MGYEIFEEDYTDEELEALGEKPEISQEDVEDETKSEEAETEDDVETEKEPEPDEEPDPTKHKPPEDNLIPQTEFDKRVGEIRTQADQKLDLLKSDPDAYYAKYPDEKPEEKQQLADTVDEGALIIEGGKFDGQTLNAVFQQDPISANKIYFNYLKDQDRQAESREAEAERIKKESDAEIAEFSDSTARELFNKDFKTLTVEEFKEVEKVMGDTLSWMQQTGRGGGVIMDAHYLMNMGNQEKKAAAQGARDVIDATNKGNIKVITSDVPGSDGLTGYEAYEAMSPDQLADEMDGWTEDKYNKFLKEAPKSLKKKYPDIPWS